MEILGEEVDTKASIHGSKFLNFYLPDPKDSKKSRKDDKEYEDTLMQMNTLHLIDYDRKYGTLYIANGGHISVVPLSYNLGEGKDINKYLTHYLIGHDDTYIR